MPVYMYEHPETGEVREEVQGMTDEHLYIDESGIEWKRVFTTSNIGVDATNVDPFSSKAFADATRDKKMSVGDLWDMSAEMSEKREKVAGEDPVLKEYNKKEKKKRKGKELAPANVRRDKNK
jgi:hypothetical protein